ASCVKDDDFNLPDDIIVKAPKFEGKVVSLSDVVKKSSEKVQVYKENEAIEGYVISSDQGGNYYKKIYVQTLDGKDGFSVAIDQKGLYSEYPLGTKVQIRLKGLSVQMLYGKLDVGYSTYTNKYGDVFVNKMLPAIYKKSVINMGEKVELSAIANEVTALADLDKYLNRLVVLKNVSFGSDFVGKAFYQKENDKGGASNSTLLDQKGNKIDFRTSQYAKTWNTKLIPKELLNITGIITKYRDFYQFKVNAYEDIEVLAGTNGGNTNNGGNNNGYTAKVVDKLDEGFDSVEDFKEITLDGWLSVKAKGDRSWKAKVYDDGSKFVQITGYKAKESDLEAWLVTPGLDVSKAQNKNFTFDTRRQFAKGEVLEVLISTDFKGDVAKATWKKLEGCKFADKSSKNFVNSGNIDLSAYNGVVYIAFKYTGNNSDKSGTFQIDNVKFNYTAGADNGGNNNNTAKVVETLNENFDSVKDFKDITLDGWLSVKTKGDRSWKAKVYDDGSKFVQITGYKAKESDLEAWLVTPGLDVSKAQNKNFTFDTRRQYAKGEVLEVLISTDFNGDVAKATWKKLEGWKLADKSSKKFVNSGNIDLSAYSGVVYIAFKYVGNNSDKSGTFQIDNVKFNYTAGTDNGGDNNGGNTDNGGNNNGATDLFFSEYVEGSGSNKYIEIYNGTGKDVDLSNYSVELYTNGKTKVGNKEELSGTLKNGEVYVIFNAQAVDDIKNKGNKDSKVTWFNGDDAIVLKKGDSKIDVIGKVGEKKVWEVAGVKNATKDHTLIRKSSVTKGNTDWGASAKNEWEVKGKNDFSSIGKR
ncbi:MAG: choice-of-anchor J domain-containing protein, partial [Flavobacteriaceae bacterium]|nr:choice-of-anchor J domain-containing protein [Flavobacteriaceae bacterium]